MGKIWAEEEYVNETEGYSFGNSGVFETFADTPGELFRSLQREYGKCISKMYRDVGDKVKTCGWVFQSRQKYEDSRRNPTKTYIREVWVTLYERKPEVRAEMFPLYID